VTENANRLFGYSIPLANTNHRNAAEVRVGSVTHKNAEACIGEEIFRKICCSLKVIHVRRKVPDDIPGLAVTF
jgi:hypothetical protein